MEIITGSYFTNAEYQKILTIIPSGNTENYHIQGKISLQNSNHYQHIYINVGHFRSDLTGDVGVGDLL